MKNFNLNVVVLALLVELVGQLGGVGEVHVLVYEAVHQQQPVLGVGETPDVRDDGAPVVAPLAVVVEVRQLHVPLRVGGVVIAPVRHWSPAHRYLDKKLK